MQLHFQPGHYLEVYACRRGGPIRDVRQAEQSAPAGILGWEYMAGLVGGW